MKKRKLLLAATIILSALCIVTALWFLFMRPPSGMSPEETVQYYYRQWSLRNSIGMDSVVYPRVRCYEDFDGMISITLLTCEEITDPAVVNEGYETWWYDKEPYAISYVDTTFDIEFGENTNTGFANGENCCGYFLVKENQYSDWVIVMWGQG